MISSHFQIPGTYIYIEASNRAVNDDAIIKSGDFLADQNRCLEFWFHMNGDGVGDLIVQWWPDTDSGPSNLKRYEDAKGDAWRLDTVRMRRKLFLLFTFFFSSWCQQAGPRGVLACRCDMLKVWRDMLKKLWHATWHAKKTATCYI